MRKNFGAKVTSGLLWIFFPLALFLLGNQILSGPNTLSIAAVPILGIDFILALRFDSLSTIMLTMVTLVFALIGQYGLRYLDGSKIQGKFYRFLLFTALAVMMLILSSNLLMFVFAWLAISWGLHHLLLLHANRPAAVYAARKKFLISRIGDVAIFAAIFLIYQIFSTFDFAEIFALTEKIGTSLDPKSHMLFTVASVLLTAGAMTKSVQWPFHFWLPETMETPTPVSALMHAGIINAGGFLVLRLSPLVTYSSIASAMLAIVGAFTAVYGALVMATQNNIKSKLAYSTISQMGMMMFACGIHAYNFALFHIIAHSFYKAHAFLSTGGLVEEKRRLSLPLVPLSRAASALIIFSGFAVVLWSGLWKNGVYLPSITYVVAALLGLSQNAGASSFPIPKTLSFRAGLTGSILVAIMVYFVVESFLGHLVEIEPFQPQSLIVNSIAFSIFACGVIFSEFVVTQRNDFAKRVYISIWNGNYFGSRSTRFLSRIWPA